MEVLKLSVIPTASIPIVKKQVEESNKGGELTMQKGKPSYLYIESCNNPVADLAARKAAEPRIGPVPSS